MLRVLQMDMGSWNDEYINISRRESPKLKACSLKQVHSVRRWPATFSFGSAEKAVEGSIGIVRTTAHLKARIQMETLSVCEAAVQGLGRSPCLFDIWRTVQG